MVAWANDPFSSNFRFLMRQFPDAKFVIWPREPDGWVESFEHFWCQELNATYPMRDMLLNYGYCREIYAGNLALCSPCRTHIAALRTDDIGLVFPTSRSIPVLRRHLPFHRGSEATGQDGLRDACCCRI